MSKLAPSVQLYTVRDAIAADLPSAIAKVAAAGFTQVEPYGFVDRADEFVDALKANNLTAPTGHAKLIGEDVVPILEAAKKLGIKTLIDPFTLPEFWTDVEAIKGFAAELLFAKFTGTHELILSPSVAWSNGKQIGRAHV